MKVSSFIHRIDYFDFTFAKIPSILSKSLSVRQAGTILLKFKTLIHVLAVNDKIIELVIVSDFKDFENAIQYTTATENGITTLQTRNLKDFRKAEIVILRAQQYLKNF